MKQYDVLDLAKFILAFFIVAIHSELWPNALYPWLRIAVPMFFVISSFLLFSKLRPLDETQQKRCVKKWVLRNIKLYLVWFVILLPVTVIARRTWFDDGILWGVLTCIRNVFLGSTFQASWFITANVLAGILIYWTTRNTGKNLPVLLVSCVVYVLCCLSSSYPTVTQQLGVEEIFNLFNIRSNFCVALIWCVIGKMFAEEQIFLGRKMCVVGLLLSLAALYAERVLSVRYARAVISSDFMVTLIPVTLFLFALLIKMDAFKLKCAAWMRNSSTLIYVMHCSIITVLKYLLPTSLATPLFVFVVTAGGVLIISMALIWLSIFNKMKFIKILW